MRIGYAMRNRFWKGLRVIEIAIILFVMCIVLSVIVFRYSDFACRSMQSEAKFSLQEIYAAQLHFHAKHDHYATLENLLTKNGSVRLPQKYFTLSDHSAPTKDSFSIMAKGVDNTLVAGEIWTINELKNIKIINAVCKN
jgi:Tfp pilus assembly protein PilE